VEIPGSTAGELDENVRMCGHAKVAVSSAFHICSFAARRRSSPARHGSGSRSNPCRARCHAAAFGHAQGRSTGQTGRQEQRSSWAPQAIAVSKRPIWVSEQPGQCVPTILAGAACGSVSETSFDGLPLLPPRSELVSSSWWAALRAARYSMAVMRTAGRYVGHYGSRALGKPTEIPPSQ
jgi:hypothetical protein